MEMPPALLTDPAVDPDDHSSLTDAHPKDTTGTQPLSQTVPTKTTPPNSVISTGLSGTAVVAGAPPEPTAPVTDSPPQVTTVPPQPKTPSETAEPQSNSEQVVESKPSGGEVPSVPASSSSDVSTMDHTSIEIPVPALPTDPAIAPDDHSSLSDSHPKAAAVKAMDAPITTTNQTKITPPPNPTPPSPSGKTVVATDPAMPKMELPKTAAPKTQSVGSSDSQSDLGSAKFDPLSKAAIVAHVLQKAPPPKQPKPNHHIRIDPNSIDGFLNHDPEELSELKLPTMSATVDFILLKAKDLFPKDKTAPLFQKFIMCLRHFVQKHFSRLCFSMASNKDLGVYDPVRLKISSLIMVAQIIKTNGNRLWRIPDAQRHPHNTMIMDTLIKSVLPLQPNIHAKLLAAAMDPEGPREGWERGWER
jgi:hypothetical protein